MLDEITPLDATAQAELVRRGEVSPVELVESAITRIERLNPALNAVITPLHEQARTLAASRRLPDGPFRGVPLLLKDYFCQVAHTPYYEGMRFLRNLKWKSKEDTYLAAKFRAAGFIFLGKTNLPELAGRPVTDSSGFGPVRNPFDPTRTAGGSSGGSAAAVASGMVPVAHGNDGTGSIRIPASCCGLVGLKPSRGRVSPGPGRSGGLLGNICEFVLTRTVRDAAALLDVLSGPMPGDVFTAPPPARPYREEVGRLPGKLRIGLLLHDAALAQLKAIRPDIADVHPECVTAVKKTGRQLESLGHIVEEAYPNMLEGPTGLGPALNILSSSGVAAALDDWEARTRRKIGPDDVEPATWARALEGRSYTAVQVQAAYQRLVAGVCRVQEWWAEGFDLLVTPTMAQLPPRLNGSATQSVGVFGLFTMPFSFTGQPAISLPLHWSHKGLPVGVQIVADYGREDLLIQVASLLEALRPWSSRYSFGNL
jgi:amidase